MNPGRGMFDVLAGLLAVNGVDAGVDTKVSARTSMILQPSVSQMLHTC